LRKPNYISLLKSHHSPGIFEDEVVFSSDCSAPLCSAACRTGPAHALECQLFQSKHVALDIADIDWKVFNAAIFPLRMWLIHRFEKLLAAQVLNF
jgi:hypothetical protein